MALAQGKERLTLVGSIKKGFTRKGYSRSVLKGEKLAWQRAKDIRTEDVLHRHQGFHSLTVKTY